MKTQDLGSMTDKELREIRDTANSILETRLVLESQKITERIVSGQIFSDEELVYSATVRCSCGAGMSYPKGIGIDGYWDCSDILTGRAKPKEHPDSKEHEAKLPFAFYDIKSECQSAHGATTRPIKK